MCPESIAPTLALLWLNEPFEYQEAIALEPADLVGRQSSGRVRQPVRGWRVVLQSVRASQGGGAACSVVSVVSQQVMVSSSGHAQGFGGLALAHHKGLDGQADRRHPYIALARHAAAVRQRATAAGHGRPGDRQMHFASNAVPRTTQPPRQKQRWDGGTRGPLDQGAPNAREQEWQTLSNEIIARSFITN